MDEAKNLWEVKICDDLDDEDLQAVADFFNEYFPGVFFPISSPDLWRWKLGPSNPSGRGFLTVAFADGRVVGTTSGTRQRIRLNGESVNAMEIGDTFTHPDFRRSGHAKKNYSGTTDENDYLNKSIFGRLVTETLDRAALAGVQYVFGTPNLNSRAPYLAKLGFSEVGYGSVRAWNLITPRYAAKSGHKYLLGALSKILRGYVLAYSTRSRRKIIMSESPFDLVTASLESDQRSVSSVLYDKGSFSFELDREFYEYRYLRHPSHKYRYFQIERNGKQIGWMICTLLERSSGRETLVISDWIAFNSSFVSHLPIFVFMITPNFPESEVTSIWASNSKVKKSEWFRRGFFSSKEVSIIERSLDPKQNWTAKKVDDFRFGWSDNG